MWARGGGESGEGGEEGADTVHTLVSENEARARWERLQSFFTTFQAYRVGNPLDRKLASGDPYSGKLQLAAVPVKEIKNV